MWSKKRVRNTLRTTDAALAPHVMDVWKGPTIIEVRGDRVQLAITAPPTVLVDRTEVGQWQPATAEAQLLVSQAAETVPAL